MAMNFSYRNQEAAAMQDFFNQLGKKAFTLSHWELADISDFPAENWKEFLDQPKVKEYIHAEMSSLTDVEQRKILMGISDRSKSTGTAQTLLALDKTRSEGKKKGGPVFIYSVVPLNPRELKAPNVQALDRDPFLTKEI